MIGMEFTHNVELTGPMKLNGDVYAHANLSGFGFARPGGLVCYPINRIVQFVSANHVYLLK